MSHFPRLARGSTSALTSGTTKRHMQSSGRVIPHNATPSTSPSTDGDSIPNSTGSNQIPSDGGSVTGARSTRNLGIEPMIDRRKVRGLRVFDADEEIAEPPPHNYKGLSKMTPTPFTPKETPLPRFTPKGKVIHYRPPAYLHSPPTLPALKSHLVETSDLTHPLWAFFHIPQSGAIPLGGLGMHLDDLRYTSQIAQERERAKREGKGEGKDEELRGLEEEGSGVGLGSIEALESGNRNLTSGRSWSAEELRHKSFTDLHTLWYLALRERNVLATQREERSRLGIQLEGELISKRAFRVRKTMSRIKYVLNERRLALMAVAESTRPSSHPAKLVAGRSPMGTADPLALSGFEGAKVVRTVVSATELGLVDGDEEGLSGGQGDGERQKSGEIDREIEGGAVVEEGKVGKAEVESRDEGFGGGTEAKEFVKEMERAGL